MLLAHDFDQQDPGADQRAGKGEQYDGHEPVQAAAGVRYQRRSAGDPGSVELGWTFAFGFGPGE